jgi:hypothetical protein
MLENRFLRNFYWNGFKSLVTWTRNSSVDVSQSLVWTICESQCFPSGRKSSRFDARIGRKIQPNDIGLAFVSKDAENWFEIEWATTLCKRLLSLCIQFHSSVKLGQCECSNVIHAIFIALLCLILYCSS